MNIRFKTWKITVSLLVFCFFTWGCLFFFENDLYAASGGLVVVSTDPANGETNVPVNKTITLTFDKEIYPGDNIGEIALIKGNDWLEVSAGPVQNQLVIKPVSELDSGAMYYLYLPPGSVKGLETEFVLDFQTVSAGGDKLAVNQSTNIMKKNTALQANALSSAESGALINPVDVVFAIDNTGSMGGTIDTVKRDVKSIVDQIRTVAPDSRFGAIKFMDYGSTSDYVTEIACQPTDQIDVLKSAVNTMYTYRGAGGDEPEAYIEAVNQGVNDIAWRKTAIKLLVVVGDAMPHDPVYGTGRSGSGKTWSEAADSAANAGVVVSMVAVGRGVGHSVVYKSYNYMAAATGGKYVESSNPSLVSAALIDLIKKSSTENPMVVHTYPADGDTGIELSEFTPCIQVVFNMDMDPKTINNRTIYVDGGYARLTIEPEYDAATRTLRIWTNEDEINYNHKYTVTLNGIKTSSGVAMPTYQFSFWTRMTTYQYQVLGALNSFQSECLKTVEHQRDRTATLITKAGQHLAADEIFSLINDTANMFMDWKIKGNPKLFRYGPRKGLTRDMQRRLIEVRNFMQQDTIKNYARYRNLHKMVSHSKGLLNLGDNIKDYNAVNSDLDNKLEHFGQSTEAAPDPPVVYKGVKQVKDRIGSLFASVEIPEWVDTGHAGTIEDLLERQKAHVIEARTEEVWYDWYTIGDERFEEMRGPFGHLLSFEEELNWACDLMIINDSVKGTITLAKTGGLLLKAGGVAAFCGGITAPISGGAFTLGEKLFWTAKVTDLVWNIPDTAQPFVPITITPKEAVKNTLVEVRDSLEDENWLIMDMVENTLGEIKHLLEVWGSGGTEPGLASAGKRLLAGSPAKSTFVEIVSLDVPDIDRDAGEYETAVMKVKNTGTNPVLASVNGIIYGPETQGGRALIGATRSAGTIAIPPGETREFTLIYTGVPLLYSGLSGCQLVMEIPVKDVLTGERWKQGPVVSNYYVVNEQEKDILKDVKTFSSLQGAVTPGIRQEMLVNVPSDLQSVIFSMSVAEGSDADLHLYGPGGEHTGMDYASGVVVNQISNSVYSGVDAKIETIRVGTPAAGTYALRVVGQSGPASFAVSQMEVPQLNAVLSADKFISGGCARGESTVIYAGVRETGGSRDINGLVAHNTILSDSYGNVIDSRIEQYPGAVAKGEGILIPLSVTVPVDAPVGTYKGEMTIWCSAGEQTVEIEFTVGEGDGDEGGSEIEWPAKTNVSPGRVWTVKFNMPVENSDVNKNNVYVVNSRNELENVNVGPGSDGRSIVVTPPEGGYKAGESYTLYITNRIRATTGQFLKNSVRIPFTIRKPLHTVVFTVGSNIYAVDGQSRYMDVAPYIKNDRTYVPVLYAAQGLDAGYIWVEQGNSITLLVNDRVTQMQAGSNVMLVNGVGFIMDVAPELVSGQIMAPVRFVAEALDACATWDDSTQTITFESCVKTAEI